MSKKRYCRSVQKFMLIICCMGSVTAHSAERGAVTALAAGGSQAAAFIGFSTGAVLYCTRLSGCAELEGTPESAVTAVDTPRTGNDVRAWVGYEDGSVYYCTLTGGCMLQKQELSAEKQPGELLSQPKR